MLYTESCGCKFEVQVGYACCGSCHCMCDSYDTFEAIESIWIEELCEAHAQ